MRDHTNWQVEATAACAGVGGMLREARESLGLSLREVSADTRVRYTYLEAIEEGRFHDLPGRTYVPAFLRTYAKRVSLDAERVLEAYRAVDTTPSPAAAYNFPVAPKERRTPKAALLLASCALLFGAYVTWHALTREPGAPSQIVAPVPDRLKPPPVVAIVPAPDPAPPAVSVPVIASPPAVTASPSPAPGAAPVQAISPAEPLPSASPAPITDPVRLPTVPPIPTVIPSPGQAQAATPPARPQDAGGQSPTAQEASRPPDLPKPVEIKPPEPKAAVITAPASNKPVTLLPKSDGWLELRGPNGEVLASTFVRAGEPYTVPEGIGYRLTPDSKH
jgi:cytoskeletal protein RodZ